MTDLWETTKILLNLSRFHKTERKMCGDKMCEVSLLYLDDWCLADEGAL